MKLIVQNKFMSIHGSSTVKDEEGNDFYVVKGKMLSPFATKFIRSLDKKVLFKVRNKFWHAPFTETCIIYKGKKQKVAIFREKHDFKITTINYEVVGTQYPLILNSTPFSGKYDIVYNNVSVGCISSPELNVKDFFRLTDKYIVDINDENDAALLVAITICLDNIHDKLVKKHK